MGKEAKFFKALQNGRTISRREAKAQFRLGNPSATVLRIVDAGNAIRRTYTTKKIKGNYITTVKYSLA